MNINMNINENINMNININIFFSMRKDIIQNISIDICLNKTMGINSKFKFEQ